jgi:hypothetical protein
MINKRIMLYHFNNQNHLRYVIPAKVSIHFENEEKDVDSLHY